MHYRYLKGRLDSVSVPSFSSFSLESSLSVQDTGVLKAGQVNELILWKRLFYEGESITRAAFFCNSVHKRMFSFERSMRIAACYSNFPST